ncbi:hypothetical protein MKW98_003105, partial [Papaver atlanticum]
MASPSHPSLSYLSNSGCSCLEDKQSRCMVFSVKIRDVNNKDNQKDENLPAGKRHYRGSTAEDTPRSGITCLHSVALKAATTATISSTSSKRVSESDKCQKEKRKMIDGDDFNITGKLQVGGYLLLQIFLWQSALDSSIYRITVEAQSIADTVYAVLNLNTISDCYIGFGFGPVTGREDCYLRSDSQYPMLI